MLLKYCLNLRLRKRGQLPYVVTGNGTTIIFKSKRKKNSLQSIFIGVLFRSSILSGGIFSICRKLIKKWHQKLVYVKLVIVKNSCLIHGKKKNVWTAITSILEILFEVLQCTLVVRLNLLPLLPTKKKTLLLPHHHNPFQIERNCFHIKISRIALWWQWEKVLWCRF